jgi:NitT/TauT family transport system permease protein
MVDSAPTLLDATWSTGSRAVVGFFIGLAVGTLFGVLMIQSRWIEYGLVPYILASQMIPLIALVPILRAILKDADLVRLYVTAYVSFFVVSIAVLRGLKNAAPTALELMGSLNASRWTTLRYLQLPAALPYIFSGLRVAAPLSLIGAILVDFLGARNGLGYLLVASLSIGSSQSTLLWAALVVSLALGLLFTRSVVIVERRMSFWQPAFREEAR